MKLISRKLILVWMGLIAFCLIFTGISYSRLDRRDIEGLWLFDEGKGDVVGDSSGNGRDGEIFGAKWVDGKYGAALEFDGTNDHVVVGSYCSIGGTDPRTTCLWFKANEAKDHSWVKWGVNVAGEKYYIRAHPEGNSCYLRVEVNGGQSYGTTDVCDGEWHHLAVVFPEGSDSVKDHELYVDGVFQNEPRGADQVMNTSNDTQEVNIGAPLANHTYANGMMDEIAIFNVALTEDDVNNIMNTGLSRVFSVEYDGKLTTTWAMVKTRY